MAGKAQLWESTTWGKGTAHTFGQEALSGLAAAIGMPGIQLTVLSLRHVDLGDTGIQLLCRGIGRYCWRSPQQFHQCVKHGTLE